MGVSGGGRRCDLEVSSVFLVFFCPPVSSLGYVSNQSPQQHYISHTHTPPFFLEPCQSSTVESE